MDVSVLPAIRKFRRVGLSGPNFSVADHPLIIAFLSLIDRDFRSMRIDRKALVLNTISVILLIPNPITPTRRNYKLRMLQHTNTQLMQPGASDEGVKLRT